MNLNIVALASLSLIAARFGLPELGSALPQLVTIFINSWLVLYCCLYQHHYSSL